MSAPTPKVSVVIPVYNAKRFLKTLIESLVGQSYGNIEIILVNDGSTDGSLATCLRYEKADGRITVVDKPGNEGVDAARFRGLDRVTGDFVTFVDADDWVDRDYIAKLVNTAVCEEADIVYVGMRRVYSRRLNIVREQPFGRKDLCGRKIEGEEKRCLSISWMGINIVPVNLCGALFRRRLFDEPLHSTGLRHGDDLAMSMQLYERADSIFIIDTPLYNYRWGGVTSKFQPEFLQSIKHLVPVKLAFSERSGVERGRNTIPVELANCLATHIQQLVDYSRLTPEEIEREIEHEMADPIYACFESVRDIPYFKKGDLNTACVRLEARQAFSIARESHGSPKARAIRLLRKIMDPIVRLIR